jgi:hypothetical protein
VHVREGERPTFPCVRVCMIVGMTIFLCACECEVGVHAGLCVYVHEGKRPKFLCACKRMLVGMTPFLCACVVCVMVGMHA